MTASTNVRRSTSFLAALALGSAALAATPRAFAQTPAKGRVETVTVHGRSLEGNLSGESPDRTVSIYLPPSYERERSRRYPVVILLHGYSLTNAYWVGGQSGVAGVAGIDVPAAMDRDVASGKAREMILVMPDGNSIYDGSMYSSSATSGDWESFIAEDLVGYVDSHYRTIAERSARGLAGHSMGGYGTWRIGMKRPDVFASLYALSSCCLMNDPAGFAQRAAAAPNGSDASGSAARRTPFANVAKAEAAAWSPNPKNPPTYYDLPGAPGVDETAIAEKWAANSPLIMLDQYVASLKRYSAIGMDVGLQDTLKASNEQLAQALDAYGIEHTFATYEGDHTNHIADRMEQFVLPFFSQHLKAERKH
jgi:S-formylglutathione hydrolase FrmB